MLRLALLATLCAGLPLCADDPPKKLSPEERKELDAKWRESMIAGGKAYQAGNLPDAVKAHEEALRLARQLYPKVDFPEGHVNLATSLNNLAVVYKFQGKLAEAEPLYKDALETTRRLFKGDHPAVASSLNNLAVLYQALGKLADAEPLCKDALEMRRRLFKGDHLDLAQNLNNLAVVYKSQGMLAEAEPLYKEALEMRRRLLKADHPDLAQSLNNLAVVYKSQGRLAEAELLLKDSLEMHRRLFKRDHPSVATSLNNLALLHQAQGKLAEAEMLFKEALEIERRLFKGDHPSIATSLNGLAGLYRAQRNEADAESLFKEALRMERRLFKGDHPAVASSLNNLGVLYQDQGKLADAEPLCKEALGMNRRLFKGDHLSIARSLNNLALLCLDQGKLAEAEMLFKEALEMERRLFKGDHPSIAISLNNLAGFYHAQGKLAEAEALYQDALGMQHRLITEFAVDKSEGETLTFLTTAARSRDAFLTLELQAKAAGSAAYPVVWADRATVARIYERRHQAARAMIDPKAAKLVADLAENRHRRAELLLAPETRDPASRNQREAHIRAFEKRILALDRELRPLLPTINRTEKLAKSTPADLQKVFPADAAVVDFLRYTPFEFDPTKPHGEKAKKTRRYTGFVLTRDTITWVELDTAQNIDAAVAAWREAITNGKMIPREIPARVRELVWEKVRKELPANIKTVYIAPDDSLCRVPWGALPGDKPGTILLEDFAIATIPHAPFLLDKLWPQDPIKNPPTGSLVVGGVNFDAEATTGPANRDLPIKPGTVTAWPALPGAAAEATGVESAAKKTGSVTALRGEAATSTAVLAALPKANYAHFATHGFFADPSFRSAFQLDEKEFAATLRGERIGRAALSPLVMTGLVFAGANNPKTPGRGIVTGEALVDLDLSGLELAVLSACETGLGDVAGGEGSFGLQRAFHLAGTRDVVASLWKVPDAPTAALMAEFYRNLWEKKQPPIQALREAQLFIYRNPGKIADLAAGFRAGFKVVPGAETEIKPTPDGKAHPRLWAAFTLSGLGR